MVSMRDVNMERGSHYGVENEKGKKTPVPRAVGVSILRREAPVAMHKP